MISSCGLKLKYALAFQYSHYNLFIVLYTIVSSQLYSDKHDTQIHNYIQLMKDLAYS